VQLVVELAGHVVDVEVHDCLGRPVSRARDEVEAVTARTGVVCCGHEQDARPEWGLCSVLDVHARDEETMPGHDGVEWRE
jgi:hypothetical protein